VTVRPKETDVVVVGAGPAGCVLAYLLARSGVDVTLLERESDLSRSFRGYYFQPLVVRLLDQMGLLEDLLAAVPHERWSSVSVRAFGRTYDALDYTVLSESPQYGLVIEQPPLLRFLIDRAATFDSFTFHRSVSVTDLRTDETGVRGVVARDRTTDTEWTLLSRLVVGADGRFSTVRHAAGIDPCRTESRLRLVWFKIPRGTVERPELGRVEPGGVLGYIPLGGNVQVLALVSDDEYDELRAQGIEALHRRVVAVDPALRPALEAHLGDFDQCSVLAPDPGISEEWVRDGLLLVGDAAHVANPFGAQGNSLAVQDAVAAHPRIARALTDSGGPLRAEQLRAYEDVRRPAVREVMDVQAQQLRAISLYVRYREAIPTAVWTAAIRGALETVTRVPRLGRRRVLLYAFGPYPVPVDTSLFET
jgi:2-polyprenyl-6-methoxyphenol hydroxylase-like FAD-dependent oxidoreductase